ncbi:MAG: hypothetical protein J5887_03065, partial [Erysipelotrichaceae bacterium]|nr:hypothetical protein [Erysipelotrichaceae bacterium]
DADILTITMTDTLHEYDIPVIKVDEDGEPVAGAKLQIFDAEGEKVAEWTTTTEPKTVKLTAGSYTLHEETAPTGYDKAEDIEFTVDMEGHINGDANIVTITMTDTLHEYDIPVIKVDEDGEPVENAKLQIFDAEGEKLAEWITTTEQKVLNLTAGTYTLHEETAPTGYDKAEDIEFTVTMEGKINDDETILVITMTDTLHEYEIPLLKVDKDGEPVVGAKLQLLDGEGEVIEEWTSTADPKIVKLTAGDYTLHETEAPQGYKDAEDVDFTVNMDGTINEGNQTVKIVTMTDLLRDYTVGFLKIDEDGNPVEGAKLQIMTLAGEMISEFTSETEVTYLTLNPGEYVLHEVEAPVGYETAEDVYFTVEMNSDVTVGGETVNVVKMTDTLTHYDVPFEKVDEDGNALAGAALQVYTADGELVEEFTSKTEPTTLQLTPGNYYLHEAETPNDEAYFYAEDVYFTVAMDGKVSVDGKAVQIVSMTDDKIYKMILSKKVINEDPEAEKFFSFTIRITGKPNSQYTVDLSKASTEVEGHANPTAFGADETGAVEVTVYLLDGESITITGLAKGAEFSVEVIENDAESYDTTVKDNLSGKESDGKNMSTTLEKLTDKGLIVEFTNNWEEVPNTGERSNLQVYGFTTLYAVLAMGAYWALTRKREDEEEN